MVIFDAPLHQKFRSVSKIKTELLVAETFSSTTLIQSLNASCVVNHQNFCLFTVRISDARPEFSSLLRRYTLPTGKYLPTFPRHDLG